METPAISSAVSPPSAPPARPATPASLQESPTATTGEPPRAALPEPKVVAEFAVTPQSMMSDLEKVIRSVNELMDKGRSNLSFSIDEQLNRTLVKVTDSVTGEVIRELPPEAVLNVARSIEELKGVLFSDRA